jgi:flavin reductase (DIM6/NTAB) family NADH-FMN oxidoreductase RutF
MPAAEQAANIFAHLDRELWVVTTQAAGRSGGLIATFVSNASIVAELPRVLVGLAKQHHSWKLVEASKAFALHLLREDQLDMVWRFGAQSGHQVDKLQDLRTTTAVTGSPILSEALAWLDCRVETRLDSGDRTIYLAEIAAAEAPAALRPLTMQRLLQTAPADKLRILRQQFEHDAAVDAAAIRAWRQACKESGRT